MASRFQVRIKDHDGAAVVLFTLQGSEFIRMTLSHIVNGIGRATLQIDGALDFVPELAADYQIEVLRSNPEYGIGWYTEWEGLIVKVRRYLNAAGVPLCEITALGYADLIKRRIIAYHAGTAYTEKAGAGESVIKEYVDQNAGAAATFPPRLEASGVTPGLSIQTDGGAGEDWEGSRSYKNLLDVIQEIALVTNVDFDVIGTGAAEFEFRTYENQRGTDRSNLGLNPATGLNAAGNPPVRFSVERGNMITPEFWLDHSEERNAIYVLGQGTGAARMIRLRANTTAIAVSPFNRREMARNDTRDTTTDALDSLGDSLLRENQAQEFFGFEVLQTSSMAYGRHYSWGDIVVAGYQEREEVNKIVGAAITVDADEGEVIRVQFSDTLPLNLSSPAQLQAFMLKRTIQRLENIETTE